MRRASSTLQIVHYNRSVSSVTIARVCRTSGRAAMDNALRIGWPFRIDYRQRLSALVDATSSTCVNPTPETNNGLCRIANAMVTMNTRKFFSRIAARLNSVSISFDVPSRKELNWTVRAGEITLASKSSPPPVQRRWSDSQMGHYSLRISNYSSNIRVIGWTTRQTWFELMVQSSAEVFSFIIRRISIHW